MADRYARELAARGFAALSFDFTGFGASDGEPRDLESAA
jgi:alpha/beta superfamily hydrolase